MIQKICNRCNLLLNIDKYRKVSKNDKSYYRNICKKCVVLQRRQYHKENYINTKYSIQKTNQSCIFPDVIYFYISI